MHGWFLLVAKQMLAGFPPIPRKTRNGWGTERNGWSTEFCPREDPLACAEVDEAGEEESGEDVEEPVLAAKFAGDEMKDGPGDDAEAQAIGDGISERDQDKGEERWHGDEGIGPANLSDGGEHKGADQNERGGGGRGGHNADEGSSADGTEEEQTGDDGGDAAAATGEDAGGGLDVAGDGGGSGEGTEDGGGGVGEENAVETGD